MSESIELLRHVREDGGFVEIPLTIANLMVVFEAMAYADMLKCG